MLEINMTIEEALRDENKKLQLFLQQAQDTTRRALEKWEEYQDKYYSLKNSQPPQQNEGDLLKRAYDRLCVLIDQKNLYSPDGTIQEYQKDKDLLEAIQNVFRRLKINF